MGNKNGLLSGESVGVIGAKLGLGDLEFNCTVDFVRVLPLFLSFSLELERDEEGA